MKHVSFLAIIVGIGMLLVVLLQTATGHPPYAPIEAFFLAALMVILSVMGGFEWGLMCLVLQAIAIGLLRDAWGDAAWLMGIAWVWYIGATLLAVRGSRVLIGIAAGALFWGLLLDQLFTFTLQQWLVCSALFLLEVSGMYLAGNLVKGRWFSPYA